MDYENAMEMMEALNSDNEMSITNIDGYAEDIAQALFNKLQKTTHNSDLAKCIHPLLHRERIDKHTLICNKCGSEI